MKKDQSESTILTSVAIAFIFYNTIYLYLTRFCYLWHIFFITGKKSKSSMLPLYQ